MKNRKKHLAQSGHQRAGKAKQIAEPGVDVDSQSQGFHWDASMLDAQVSDDPDCPWSWRLEPDQLHELMQFLSDSSRRTWAELEADRTGGRVRHKKHHEHAVASLCTAAQRRFLAHVGDESFDTMFRLRYGGTKRLWGIRDRTLFRIVWVDLDHKVYPTEP